MVYFLQQIKAQATPYNLVTVCLATVKINLNKKTHQNLQLPTIPQLMWCKMDWHRPTMDRLLKNNIQGTTIQLTCKQDSIAFLAYIYPERHLLPEKGTIEGLFRILQSKGHYKGTTKGKWVQYPVVGQSKDSDHENKLTKFLNSVCATVHSAYGISCLWVLPSFISKIPFLEQQPQGWQHLTAWQLNSVTGWQPAPAWQYITRHTQPHIVTLQ